MSIYSKKSILIIEPNRALAIPFMYLPRTYEIHCVHTAKHALYTLSKNAPDLIFLSSSFEPETTVKLLEAIKNRCRKKIIPLVYVIDLNVSLITIPGTTWGGKLGIAHSLTSQQELYSTLERLMSKA